jgi:hypothetical protein
VLNGWDGINAGPMPDAGSYHGPVLSGADGNSLIAATLREGRPSLVGRLGGTEGNVCTYWCRYRRQTRYPRPPYPPGFCRRLHDLAGFFPNDARSVDGFAEAYLDAFREVDVLAAWLFVRNEHVLARRFCPSARIIRAQALDSFVYDDPWSAELAGRRVLVVHPFASSIERQYRERRQLLFADPRVLPEFDLVTIPAVQSLAGNQVPFPTWFDALGAMSDRIERTEFDVAIIGAGAYGLPLGAHVKGLGRQAVVMGGITQMLFGIAGRRWETESQYGDRYRRLVNDSWVRPSADETPPGASKVEDACYW